jgi:hypothetical protein
LGGKNRSIWVTLIVDATITHNDLPNWMRLTKAAIQPQPSQATRDIQGALYSLQPDSFKPPFVGRAQYVSGFVQAVSMHEPPLQVFVVTGLEGVGRRTYLERACQDNLGLSLGPFFLFDETKRAEDVYLWLFNETGDFKTRTEIKDELEAFGALTSAEQTEEILRRLGLLCGGGCIPTFVDYGGMLEENGTYVAMLVDILKGFRSLGRDNHLALVHQRFPLMKDLDLEQYTFQQKLAPLNANESKLLLQQLFRLSGVKASPEQTGELLEYLGGYPPSMYLAARHAKDYGLSLLLADKSVLVDFQVKRFTGLINKLHLNEKEWLILQYLGSEQLVPFSIIPLVVGADPSEVAPMLRNLIERSLVVMVGDSYCLSSPIRSAVENVKGNLDGATYRGICGKLTKAFWEGPDAAPSIEIVDATLHAAARAGDVELAPYADLFRVSTLHKLARECYHRREWQRSLDYVERAARMAPASREIRELYFRALLRLERWDDARKKLSEIEDSGSRNFFYLKGFFHRVRGEFKQAVDAFESAELTGMQSAALSRDLADCLHRQGNDKAAFRRIESARKRDPANIFVLDLYVRICLANKKIGEAELALSELERYDAEEKFIHHRKSTILAARMRFGEALTEAELAVRTGKNIFAAYAQRADLLIELGQFGDATKALDELKDRFGQFRKLVQFGLKCKLLIRKGDWRQAEIIWGELKSDDPEINNILRRQIFELKAHDPAVPLAERNQARDEAALLDPDLRNIDHVLARAQDEEES